MRFKSGAIPLFSMIIILLTFGLTTYAQVEGKRALTYEDIMRFQEIRNPVISQNGEWVAYVLEPGRGDGAVRIYSLQNKREFNLERGSQPTFSEDAHWVAMTIKPGALDLARADSKDKPKQGLALLNTQTGKIDTYDEVQGYAFSKDSHWLAFHYYAEKDKKEKQDKTDQEKLKQPDKVGSTFVLLDLSSEKSIEIPYVLKYAFDDSSRFLAYVLADPEGRDNGLFSVDLQDRWGTESPSFKRRWLISHNLPGVDPAPGWLLLQEFLGGRKKMFRCGFGKGIRIN